MVMPDLRISPWAMMIAVAAGTAACHHTPSKSSILSPDRLGVYQFSEHVTAGGDTPETIDIEGQVTVLEDSVIVDARPGPCRLDAPTLSPYPFAFRCGTVGLSFDRRDPILHASYTASLAHNVSHQVCTRYGTQPGARACVEFRSVTSQEFVLRRGPLHLTRVPD
jgi:hypothetical protein